MKKKFFKIANILQPIICVLIIVGVILSLKFSLNRMGGKISSGGNLREWYWYENLIMCIPLVLSVAFIILEIMIFCFTNKKYKAYTIIYTLIELVIIYYYIITKILCMSIVSIFMFNLVKCIFRLKRINDCVEGKIVSNIEEKVDKSKSHKKYIVSMVSNVISCIFYGFIILSLVGIKTNNDYDSKLGYSLAIVGWIGFTGIFQTISICLSFYSIEKFTREMSLSRKISNIFNIINIIVFLGLIIYMISGIKVARMR